MSLRVPEEPVSRTLEVKDTDTLYGLHLAIQDAFGWDNDHLYAFYTNNRLFDRKSEYAGDPMGGDLESVHRGAPPDSAGSTVLRSLHLRKGRRFKYRFDFGDELIHDVEFLDANVPRVEGVTYPRLVEAVGEAPPQYPLWEEQQR